MTTLWLRNRVFWRDVVSRRKTRLKDIVGLIGVAIRHYFYGVAGCGWMRKN
ncbi:hypothetical protein KCP75_20495 [Salmonella enterica subsp. enterica]|nr:hypothetical protein KCP75_20495 [Salmonella enterica subsp. enterica]